MQIIETYGKYIEKFGNEDPAKARWLLKTGWSAQNLKFRFAPDKRLIPAHRYLAHLMMNTMLAPLKRPEKCSVVSIFTPCELLHEVGLSPYNVEAFPATLQPLQQSAPAFSRQKIRGFPRPFAATIKPLSGQQTGGSFPGRSVSFIPIWYVMQTFLPSVIWQICIRFRSLPLMCPLGRAMTM